MNGARMPETKQEQKQNYDVVVIGSGAGGLSTAVTAAYHGLSVVVLERERRCGGATSRSGGWMWTPRSEFARADGVDESIDDIKTYLKAAVGDDYDEERTDAFQIGRASCRERV